MSDSSILSQSASINKAGKSFLTSYEAAKIASVSHVTILAWLKEGYVRFYKTSGNHARIDARSLRAYLFGESEEKEVEEKRGVCCFCRVSSTRQDNRGSLERQVERLTTIVADREQLEKGSIKVYKEVCSSYGTRPVLNGMIEDMISGQISKIFVENKDRFSRVESTTSLIESLAKNRGIEIIYLDCEETDLDELQAGMMELVAFAGIITARVNASKSRKVTLKEIKPEDIETIIKLRQTGLTVKEIKTRVDGLGLTTSKGDLISYGKLLKICDSNGAESILTRVVCGEKTENVDEILKDFVAKNVKKDDDSRLSVRDFYPVYVQHCEKKGLKALPNNLIGRSLRKLLPGKIVIVSGTRFIDGYSLN